MKLRSYFQAGLSVLCLVLLAPSAYASLIFTIDRISDTDIRITGTGTLTTGAPPSNAHILFLDDIFGGTLTGLVNQTPTRVSSMTLGGAPVAFAYTVSTGFNYPGESSGIYFGRSGVLTTGDGPSSGYIDLDISVIATSPIFAAPGTTGDVYWGASNGVLAGSWTMVPEPNSAIMIGLGLGALSMARRRRR